MKLPVKITPCPIIEAICEIRFNSEIHQDAIFGLVYNLFKDDYRQPEELPILQMPPTIRGQDPNLIFKPHYRFSSDDFILQVGPKVISLAAKKEYKGWSEFSGRIKDTFNRIKKIQLCSEIKRFGLRYLNFFEKNIYNNLNLTIKYRDSVLAKRETMLRARIEEDGFNNLLQLSNRSAVNFDAGQKTGFLIDIDTCKDFTENDFFDKMNDIIDRAHVTEKKLFFGLLKEDFLKTLIPEY